VRKKSPARARAREGADSALGLGGVNQARFGDQQGCSCIVLIANARCFRERRLLYGVFSGLVLAPSPPPVPAASLLLGVVALPGAF
jgi:hypothetical protein